MLACLTGDAVVEDGVYGVHINTFIHNICYQIAGTVDSNVSGHDSSTSLEVFFRSLQRVLREEAKNSSKGKKKLDYSSCFALFDLDGQGTIDQNELKKMLTRLKLTEGLSESNFPKLLGEFDRSKKGFVTLEDFAAFAESNKFGLDIEDGDYDKDDYESSADLFSISSNSPPTSVTKNADADWLLWFLWKEAVKQDKVDPEGVITDLQASCTEVEQKKDKSTSATVAPKDLWSLLSDFNLRGTMNRTQFDQGTKLFTDFVGKENNERVDYSAFCHNIVRMGRAFNALLQERQTLEDKKYSQLKSALYSQLKESGALEQSAGSSVMKFQKIMARFDLDGDGQLTITEFKNVLKTVKLKCEKDWTPRMIKLLFDEFDKNNDGRLNTDEFALFVASGAKDSAKTRSKNFLDDDDDDEDFGGSYSRKRAPREHELFKKVV
jgi:Ca2+-binding EF-hand superfamily protein